MMFFAAFIDKTLPFFFSAVPDACKEKGFLFLPPWWEYLKDNLTVNAIGSCTVKFAFPGDIWLVGLAILDMLLRIAGFAAVISIIISGFQYQFTGGRLGYSHYRDSSCYIYR
jgi:hypothetical protein